MSNYKLRILILLLSIPTASSVYAQVTAPGFDPAPLEIKPVSKTVPRPITSMDLLTIRDITGTQISPDGKSVAYVVSQAVLDTNGHRTALFVVGTAPGSVPVNLGSAGPPQWNTAGEYQRRIAPQWSPDSRYITYLMGEKDKRQVWMWNREGGKPEQLTNNAADVENYEWQSDGKRIIFTTVEPISAEEIKRVSEKGILFDTYSVSAGLSSSIIAGEGRPIARAAIEAKPRKRQTWIYDLATRTERRLTPAEESDFIKSHQPPEIWDPSKKSTVYMTKTSPDGKLIAYVTLLRNPDLWSSWKYSISVKDVSGNRSYELVPPSNEVVITLQWDKGSDKVYFTRLTEDKGFALFAAPARGGAAREITKGNKDVLSWLSFDQDISRVACIRESPTTPPEIALLDSRDGAVRTLVNVNPEFQNIKLSPATRLEWTNKYGHHFFGYLVKPLNYEPGKRYPLIVTTYYARGFLRGDAGDEQPIQVYAVNNYAVLSIDLEYGKLLATKPGDFQSAKLRWYSAMASLEQATKTLDEMGIINPQRKGLTGLSYGSEITSFTISHSDLFQAASASSSGHDPICYYVWNNFWHKGYAEWGLGGFPEGDAAENWRELSGALNAARVNAPLLIQAADKEYIPSLQMYTALKELGKPVELIVYADENHIKNQPKHRYEMYQRNVDWFNFWLQDKEDPDPTKSEQYTRWRAMRKAVKEGRPATGGSNSGSRASSP